MMIQRDIEALALIDKMMAQIEYDENNQDEAGVVSRYWFWLLREFNVKADANDPLLIYHDLRARNEHEQWTVQYYKNCGFHDDFIMSLPEVADRFHKYLEKTDDQEKALSNPVRFCIDYEFDRKLEI